MKNDFKYLLLNLTNSFHLIITQSLLSLVLSFMLNNSVIVYTLFTGLYLTFLGASSLWIDKHVSLSVFNIHKILKINTILSWVLIALIPIYLRIHTNLNDPNLDFLFLIIGSMHSILLGICSGIELPLYSCLNRQKFTIQILISDYFGSAIGMFLFNFILYPFLGINGSIITSLIISIIGFLIFILFKEGNDDHQEPHH